MRTPKSFASALADMNLPSVFNPYRDHCDLHDRADATSVRRRNLVRFLEAAIDARVDTMWIARDLGYRGGRRTGVPLTDEVHLQTAGSLLGGISLSRATRGPIIAERTAAIVWRVLSKIGEPAVLWNVFPFHPHEPADPLSNRCHTRKEREACWPLLEALVAMVRPRRIVAIGRDAGLALTNLAVPVQLVRHPSYGGQADFIAGLHEIYGIQEDDRFEQAPELPLDGGHAATAAASA